MELWDNHLYFFRMQAAGIVRTCKKRSTTLQRMVREEGQLLVELMEVMRKMLIHHMMITMEEERVGKKKGERTGKKMRGKMEEVVTVDISELGEMGVEVQTMDSPVAVRKI